MTDPKRLSDQADLPPQLKAALRMMGQNTTPPEVVERVQRSLAGLPSAGATSGFTFGWGGAVSTVAVAVAVAASVAWMRAQRDGASAVAAVSTVARAAQVEIVEPELKVDSLRETAGAETIGPATSVASAHEHEHGPNASVTAASVVREPTSAPVVRASTPRPTVLLERHARQRVVSEVEIPVVAGEQRSGSSALSGRVAPSDVAKQAPTEQLPPMAAKPTEAVAEPVPAHAARARSVVSQGPEPEDEASLVYRAKRLARTDRAAAWRLIESHTLHFPNGALVEECEVLAIDVLNGMGREREAKERAARFISRFPRSGYRSVVARSAAEPQ